LHKKVKWQILIAILMGLIIAGIGMFFLMNKFNIHQVQYSDVIIPTKQMEAYKKITENDVKVASIPVNSLGNNVAVNLSQVIGKIPLRNININEQINLGLLTEEYMVNKDCHQVSVNVSLNRSIGGTIREGDIVDVFWIEDDNIPASILTRNAIVLRVSDNEGNNLQTNSLNLLREQKVAIPAVVVLSVKPSDVPDVIKGSIDGSTGIVLVKKLKEGGDIVADTEQAE